MFGYVAPDKPELRIKEYELYSAYYCGICKSVKERYGQIPRFALNYDFVFLALLLGALRSPSEEIKRERCPVHPIRKRSVVYNEAAIDYAADMMLLLTYYKLLDDKHDEGGLKPAAALAVLKSTYKKLMRSYGEKCIMIQKKLVETAFIEEQKCTSLDRAAEPFAKLMEEVFAAEGICCNKTILMQFRKIGYHTGKWLYLIDAYDDLEEDAAKGLYNPLLLQWDYRPAEENMSCFRKRIKERTRFNLLFYLAEISKAWDCLDVERNRLLVENILYSGLLKKTEEILEKGNTEDAKSL
jgi:hypothetical protein